MVTSIRQWRHDHGFSMREAAIVAGISLTVWHEIERFTYMPNETAERALRIVGMSLEEYKELRDRKIESLRRRAGLIGVPVPPSFPFDDDAHLVSHGAPRTCGTQAEINRASTNPDH